MEWGKRANHSNCYISNADFSNKDGEDGNQAEKGENGESNTDAGSIKLTDEQVILKRKEGTLIYQLNWQDFASWYG